MGDLLKIHVRSTSANEQRSLPVCVTVLGDPVEGAKKLETEVRRVKKIEAHRRTMRALEPMDHGVLKDLMDGIKPTKYDELDKRQFVYYTQRLPAVGSCGN